MRLRETQFCFTLPTSPKWQMSPTFECGIDIVPPFSEMTLSMPLGSFISYADLVTLGTDMIPFRHREIRDDRVMRFVLFLHF